MWGSRHGDRQEVWARAVAALVAAVALAVVAGLALSVLGLLRPGDGHVDPVQVSRAEARPGPAPRLPGEVVGSLGVASYNVQWRTPLPRLRADRDRLAARRGVDLIGWQETNSPQFRELNARYRERGWETWSWEGSRTEGPAALAVSWRTDTFDLLDVDWVQVNQWRQRLAEPYPPRWVLRAQFRHHASGTTVTLLNTHLAHGIEEGTQWRGGPNTRSAKKHLRILATLWRETPGDVLLSTGDYNFDFRDDSIAVPAGGITDRFDGLATSSFAALGHEHLPPTLRTRWIDYVFLADRSARRTEAGRTRGKAQFVRHWVLEGMNSDHRPVVARLRLYA